MPLKKLVKLSLIQNRKSHILLKKSLKKQEVPENISLSASLTVEAALVFPLFLFVLIILLWFFRILQVSYITYGVLASTASHCSLQPEACTDTEIYQFFAENLEKEENSFLKENCQEIQWQEIPIDEEYLRVEISYDCKLPISLFSVKSISVCQGIRIKKWTGLEETAQGSTKEVWVYITPSKQVYHKTQECTHLKLSIHTMDWEKAIQEGYTPCLLCVKSEKKEGICYVAEDGTRCHRTLSCSGLKRTIYQVRYEDVAHLNPCQRCGGSW